MEYRRDTDGFALPPIPASTRLRLYQADIEDNVHVSSYGLSVTPSDISGTSTGSGRKSLIEDPYYRRNNLAENNIYLRPDYEEFPKDITDLISRIYRDRNSPGPLSNQLR
jgi:hypothetical protein